MKKALKILGIVVLGLVPAYVWLFLESGTPKSAFPIDLTRVRALASTLPGPRPTSVRVERVTVIEDIPAMGIVAGSGWSKGELAVYAYQLLSPAGTAILDTGMLDDKRAAFDPKAFERVQAAMTKASLIVVTHEHFDHIGGLTSHPQLAALLPHTIVTRAQLADPEKMDPAKFPAGALAGYVPLDLQSLHPVAPGVVLMSAPGHTPGSQLVFVQLASGEEFLFVGDVAWHFDNITLERERARLATLMLGEDRDRVLGQLKALHQLQLREPALHIVPGHDARVIDHLVAEKALTLGFEVP
jgi:glyoxylase-like metal-dependent hydrolase (beta-lactamase superfamily II)